MIILKENQAEEHKLDKDVGVRSNCVTNFSSVAFNQSCIISEPLS